jgi:hypothetical protein
LVSTKRYARSVTLLRSAGSQLCLCAVRAPSVVLKLSGTNGQNEKGKERKGKEHTRLVFVFCLCLTRACLGK